MEAATARIHLAPVSNGAIRGLLECHEAALRSATRQLQIAVDDTHLDRLMKSYLSPAAFEGVKPALTSLQGLPHDATGLRVEHPDTSRWPNLSCRGFSSGGACMPDPRSRRKHGDNPKTLALVPVICCCSRHTITSTNLRHSSLRYAIR